MGNYKSRLAELEWNKEKRTYLYITLARNSLLYSTKIKTNRKTTRQIIQHSYSYIAEQMGNYKGLVKDSQSLYRWKREGSIIAFICISIFPYFIYPPPYTRLVHLYTSSLASSILLSSLPLSFLPHLFFYLHLYPLLHLLIDLQRDWRRLSQGRK